MSIFSSLSENNLLQGQSNSGNKQHDAKKSQMIDSYPNLSEKSSPELLAEIYKIIDDQGSTKLSPKHKKNSTDDTQETHSWKCKCKKTRCLKLYCECFALGEYCKDCNCADCHNLSQFDELRAEAIDEAFMRDPNAFDGKSKQRKGGCICKKTGCIKKYCECFNSGQQCTNQCKCLNCENCKPKSQMNQQQGQQQKLKCESVIVNTSC